MTSKYQSSADLLPNAPENADVVLEKRKRERETLLMREYIASQMHTEMGQKFFHRLIFGMTVGTVGVCGLFDQNPEANLYREGIRAIQASVHDEVRARARPSDYAEMLMRPLGAKREVPANEERKS